MARRNLGRTPEGAVIYYFDTKAEMKAMTDVIDATAQAWLPDGSKYRANGIGGWDQTHAEGGVMLVTTGISGIKKTKTVTVTTSVVIVPFSPGLKALVLNARPGTFSASDAALNICFNPPDDDGATAAQWLAEANDDMPREQWRPTDGPRGWRFGDGELVRIGLLGVGGTPDFDVSLEGLINA